MDNITVRPFRIADQKAVRELILEGLGEHFGVIKPELNPDLDNIYSHYIKPGNLFLVCDLDGEIIGTGALIEEMDRTGRIVRVSVAQSYRRQGIGRLITGQLIKAAPGYGFNRIVVETNEDWFSAIRLYQNFGFQEFDRRNGEIHLFKDLNISTQ